MRMLVTGGAGFIGSHLSESLLGLGHQVTAIDNLSTGRKSNIEHLLRRSEFRFLNASVMEEAALEPLVLEADLIYHLAAAVGVKYIVDHPLATLETNIRGTENVLRLAQRHGATKVVLASSSEVYGNSPKVPFREDADLLIGPPNSLRWGYACSKMMDEFLALAYYKETGLPVVVLRLFNTVGPRQVGHYGMVVPRFVSQALQGKPITVYGDGTQRRCFTYVRDVVKAIIDISQNTSAEGQVFNVGSSHEMTVHQLAELVKETLGSSSPIEFVPYEEAYGSSFEDIRCRVPDISKIQGYLDYHPTTDLAAVINEIGSRREELVADK